MSKAVISKAEKIRVALQLLQPGEDLSAAQLQEVTGIDNVVVHVQSMIKSGEVIATGERGGYRYKLNPKHQPKRKTGIDRTLPVKRKNKKKKSATAPRKAAKKKRTGKLHVTPPAALNRWALASDGALVLLGTPVEIQRAAARALIDFVRVLDSGQA